MILSSMIEIACEQLPEGYVVRICMENGYAGIEVLDPNGEYVALPDPADKTLNLQLNDALMVIRGIDGQR